MKNIKHFAQRYVDWVIRLGRVRFSLLGVIILAILALCTQVLFSLFIIHKISWTDIVRSVTFGLLTAPFVIYFFTLLVERLERSRQELAQYVAELKKEVSERIIAQQRLSNALEKLEKNNEEKSTLLATISHELRTPLNGIVGLSHILLDEELSPIQQNYLKTINMSAVSLGYIFSDIIDLEKIDSRRIELNPKPTDINLFLNDIYNFANFMATQKNLNFRLIIEDSLPNWLNLDSVRLSQILWNLISNAVKFTEKGEVILKIKKSENHYHFYVSDTGIGISKEEQKHIFKLYYQVKESRNKSAGSGIGLAISKNLAQLMAGDLLVESEIGKGSTFHLSIQADAPKKESKLLAQSNVPNLSILLVEDIELNITVAKTILEKQGHSVDVAINGKQAILLFEKNLYDLILLDIKLPDMSGFDIAQYLKENYEEGIYDFLPPIIAFTANVMQSEKDYLSSGMDGVLRKPIAINELNHCLQHFFCEGKNDNREPKRENMMKNQDHSRFNFELINNIGISTYLENLTIFEKIMPNYLTELENSQNIQEVENIAHKIKGAAASVALNHIQKIAEKIEKNGDTSLIFQLNAIWQEEINELKHILYH